MTDAKKELAGIAAKAKSFVELQRKRHPAARVLSSTPMASSASAREAALIAALDKAPAPRAPRPEAPKTVQVLFVSEAAIPAESLAGKLLAKIVKAMGLAAADASVCTLQSLAASLPAFKPKVLVALGAAAAKSALGTDAEFGRLRGRFGEYQGIPLMPTHHPSELLSNEALKRHVWDDIKLVAAKLKP